MLTRMTDEADKGYDAKANRALARARGIAPAIVALALSFILIRSVHTA